MLHFEGHTLSIKKVTFAVKSGEYFEKHNIYGVNFDPGTCISMEWNITDYLFCLLICLWFYDLSIEATEISYFFKIIQWW